jgi:hypothetical protein
MGPQGAQRASINDENLSGIHHRLFHCWSTQGPGPCGAAPAPCSGTRSAERGRGLPTHRPWHPGCGGGRVSAGDARHRGGTTTPPLLVSCGCRKRCAAASGRRCSPPCVIAGAAAASTARTRRGSRRPPDHAGDFWGGEGAHIPLGLIAPRAPPGCGPRDGGTCPGGAPVDLRVSDGLRRQVLAPVFWSCTLADIP